MYKMKKVKKIGRTHAHREALISNMIASLILHERIVTTKDKAKLLKIFSEKMITKAKKNLIIDDKKSAKAVHNKRIVMSELNDRDAVAKLFDDIAVRTKDRKGGYTRIYLLGKRPGDNAEKAIIELVDRKEIVVAVPSSGSDKKKANK